MLLIGDVGEEEVEDLAEVAVAEVCEFGIV